MKKKKRGERKVQRGRNKKKDYKKSFYFACVLFFTIYVCPYFSLSSILMCSSTPNSFYVCSFFILLFFLLLLFRLLMLSFPYFFIIDFLLSPFHLQILPVIRVERLIVHDELVADKVEAITDGLERALDDGVAPLLVQLGHVVDGLPRVGGVRDAEVELEVEALDEHVAEVMALDHAEVGNGLVAVDTEHQLRADGALREKGGGEAVVDGAAARLLLLRQVGDAALELCVVFRAALDVKDDLVRVHIADREAVELNVVAVRDEGAEKAIRGARQRHDVVRRDARGGGVGSGHLGEAGEGGGRG
ncbi:GMP-PDE, delta subunit family protein [Strigomonas culicis]|uniref:GMP-PDE, delta subunit family protein n=1 Tax=Strigomonas culicis TaxID=28005 RepID=S9VX29_9TRYP|nr:GMP-PDE, delta subunit family protein [Strigomonas culicis]|eukprot:EPY31586.1 GMP-PDE, delta subunit family protein [Strigomonas culicis]